MTKPAVAQTIDVRTPEEHRLPPGQIVTHKWPVLHYGEVPYVDLTRWRFVVTGLVQHPISLTWQELHDLPKQDTRCDMHCVTRWSRYDNLFTGTPIRAILDLVKPLPEASVVMVHAAPDYTTNVPLEHLDREANLLATHHDGVPLTAEHGGPVRLLVPHLYLWKSAKWVTGFEFMEDDYPGFWEQNGYHMRGDPWTEERFGRPDYTRMRRGKRQS